MKPLALFAAAVLFVLITGCNDRDESAKTSSAAGSGMKCGAGKCGANMFDGNVALAKKKANITLQMHADDPRSGCVANAATTKALYDCVRDPETGRLSKQWEQQKADAPMKCGVGKCGAE